MMPIANGISIVDVEIHTEDAPKIKPEKENKSENLPKPTEAIPTQENLEEKLKEPPFSKQVKKVTLGKKEVMKKTWGKEIAITEIIKKEIKHETPIRFPTKSEPLHGEISEKERRILERYRSYGIVEQAHMLRSKTDMDLRIGRHRFCLEEFVPGQEVYPLISSFTRERFKSSQRHETLDSASLKKLSEIDMLERRASEPVGVAPIIMKMLAAERPKVQLPPVKQHMENRKFGNFKKEKVKLLIHYSKPEQLLTSHLVIAPNVRSPTLNMSRIGIASYDSSKNSIRVPFSML